MPAHLKIQCHLEGMSLPRRGHASDVGLDLSAYAYRQINESVFFFDTGISVRISQGFYTEVVPRSSIVKSDFMLANSVGVIDPDYRGRIFVPFRYLGGGDAKAAAEKLLNKRIAQLIVRRLEPCTIEFVASLDETDRGIGGFGSTGD